LFSIETVKEAREKRKQVLAAVSTPRDDKGSINGILRKNTHCKRAMICYNNPSMLHPTPIDISANPELLRIAEEVAATKTPRELKRDNQTVAVIMPATTKQARRKTRVKTKADYEAFRSAAGGWKDVDTDKLLADIYADRKRSNSRPPIKL
jgi:hypothetical protein